MMVLIPCGTALSTIHWYAQQNWNLSMQNMMWWPHYSDTILSATPRNGHFSTRKMGKTYVVCWIPTLVVTLHGTETIRGFRPSAHCSNWHPWSHGSNLTAKGVFASHRLGWRITLSQLKKGWRWWPPKRLMRFFVRTKLAHWLPACSLTSSSSMLIRQLLH